MSKKSVKRQTLFILFSLSCLAYAGPKKNPEQQTPGQQEAEQQAEISSANQKRRPEKDDHQEQLGQSVSKGKKRLVEGPVGQLPTQHIDSMQEEKIDPSKQDLNANINANNALNFQQESRSRFGKEEKQNSLQQSEYLTQQNTGDRLNKQNFIPVLEQISGMVQEQYLALQNASEIKEQAGERQETAVAQFFKSDYPFRLMTSFLSPEAFVNFAHTNKKIYKQLLDMHPFNGLEKARARFAQDGSSSFFGLQKTMRREGVVEFLSDPDKKPLLRRCLEDGKLCITLDDVMIPLLNKEMPHWKKKLANLQAPIVVCGEVGFNFLKDPLLSSQIIAGEVFFGFGYDEGFIERNALLPLIQERNILLRVSMTSVRTRQEVTKTIEDLFKTKQVVHASLSSALLTEPFLDLSSLRHLDLRCIDRPQFYALAESLVTRSPNLEHLEISHDTIGVLGAKGVPVLSLKWEKLKIVNMRSWQFQSYNEFKAFYRALPRGLTKIGLPDRKFNCKQLSEFVEYLPALSHLECRFRVDLEGKLSLEQWIIRALEKNQNLTALRLEIDHNQLTESKNLELQNKEVLLPHINDLHVKLCINSFGSRDIKLFSEHMMGVLSLLDMHADSENQMGNKKRISILISNFTRDRSADDWNKQISYLAEIIQKSGSHVEFRFEENTALCLKKSELLSEQDKKRIVF